MTKKQTQFTITKFTSMKAWVYSFLSSFKTWFFLSPKMAFRCIIHTYMHACMHTHIYIYNIHTHTYDIMSSYTCFRLSFCIARMCFFEQLFVTLFTGQMTWYVGTRIGNIGKHTLSYVFYRYLSVVWGASPPHPNFFLGGQSAPPQRLK